MSQVKNVISICAVKDAATWVHVSRAMTRYIDAENFFVIVPSDGVDIFRALSPARFTVIDEDSLLAGLNIAYVAARMPEAMRVRAGWYFQQLIKLLALVSVPADPDDVLLLWDADTMPMHRLSFQTESGQLLYCTSDEHHQPYFDAIQRLLGTEKMVAFSFVAQSFPIFRRWAEEFIALVERRSGQRWIDAILEATDLSLPSAFSEFETLGAFVAENYPQHAAVNSAPWARDGYLRGLTPEMVSNSETLGREFAYVAFESWLRDQGPVAEPRTSRAFPRPWDIDPFLDTFFNRFTGDRAVIQVGANDGVIADPLRRFLADERHNNVRAVLCEPLRYYYEKLCRLYTNRPNTVLMNVACGSAAATRKFYFIDPDMASEMNGEGPPNDWAHGQGSFYRESVEFWINQNSFRGEAYRANLSRYLSAIVESDAFVMPLNRFRLPNVETLLILDVQGAELDVLAGLDWLSPPQWIVLEQDRGRSDTISTLMEAFDYEYVCGAENVLFARRAHVRWLD